MKQFCKEDPEYRGNGHYVIEGIEYMSVWTFKNKFFMGINTTKQNGEDAISLSSLGVKTQRSKPDFGNFDNIYIYPVSDLNNFYQKK
jgi:hypothetical protein